MRMFVFETVMVDHPNSMVQIYFLHDIQSCLRQNLSPVITINNTLEEAVSLQLQARGDRKSQRKH